MNKPLHEFFTKDHHRIDDLLNRATKNPGDIDMEIYHAFRIGLLRHIKMEENILFKTAKEIDGPLMKKLIPRFRREHGALTALMVPPPDAPLLKAIRYVLEKHDEAEEKPGGLYDVCEELTKDQTEELLKTLAKTPEVPVHPHNEDPIAMRAARNALKRANYDYDEIVARG